MNNIVEIVERPRALFRHALGMVDFASWPYVNVSIPPVTYVAEKVLLIEWAL